MSQTEPLLATVLSLMPDAAVVVDAKGTVVAANAHAEELFGYEPGVLVGLSIEALVPERFRPAHREHRSAYASSPRTRPMGTGLELYARRQDGTEFPVDIMLAPVREGPLVIAAVRDITERKAAEAAQAELAAIVQSSNDGILSMTEEGVITSWNPGAEKMFGFRPEDVVGRHISLLFPDDPVLDEMLALARKGEAPLTRDTRWQTSAGRVVDVAISVSPLVASSSRGYSLLVRDITERTEAEARLRRQARWLEATAEIRLSLLAEATLEESLTVLCHWAAELGSAQATAVLLAEGGRARVAARSGEEVLPLGVLPRVPTLVAQAIASGVPEHGHMSIVPDLAAVALPIVSQGRKDDRAGALVVLRQEGSHLDEEDVSVLSGLASQASLALELDAVRADRDRLLISADRERIARDLHDLVIQRLFGAGLRLQGALSLIDSQPAASRVASTIDDLDTTIKEIREAIFALESAPGTSLRARVLETVADATEALGFGPVTSFHGLGDREVGLQTQLELAAVLREALSNVARHAHASQVEVTVTLEDDLSLVVVDNGTGIGKPRRLSGIANARARAELLGGSLQVSAVPAAKGGGTRFEWRVPLGPEHDG